MKKMTASFILLFTLALILCMLPATAHAADADGNG
jgi:hypothetical protein